MWTRRTLRVSSHTLAAWLLIRLTHAHKNEVEHTKMKLSCDGECEHATSLIHSHRMTAWGAASYVFQMSFFQTVNIKMIVLTCHFPGHNQQRGLLRSTSQALLTVWSLTCLPCTKTLVILGARLSTSLVNRLAARRTTDLVDEKTQEQSLQITTDS